MQKTFDMKLTADEAEKITTAIEKSHRIIHKLFKEMKKDQIEIERLKKETRRMLAEMKAS